MFTKDSYSLAEFTDTCVQSPPVVDFTDHENVVDAFTALMRVLIKELRNADLKPLK